MITVELLSFIKKELAGGKTKEQIKSELSAGGGWSVSDIEEALKNIDNSVTIPISRKLGITNVLPPVNLNPESKHKLVIALVLIGLLVVAVFFFFKNYTNVSFIGGTSITSGAHSLSNIPENEIAIARILNNNTDAHTSSDYIRKSDDGRFWEVEVYWEGCWDGCSKTYVVDTQKLKYYELKHDIYTFFHAFDEYFIALWPDLEDSKNIILFDADKNKVVDEFEVSQDLQHFVFGHRDYYAYVLFPDIMYSDNDGVVYLRDLKKHNSIEVGRAANLGISWDDPDLNGKPLFFSLSGDKFYALIPTNKVSPNIPFEILQEDDPLELVEWDLKTLSKRVVTDQIFNYPFTFELLPNNNILIGGGRDQNGVMTLHTYLVNLDSGESKKIYDGATEYIRVNKDKKQIHLFGFDSEQTSGPYQSSLVAMFDYSGNLLSEIYFENSFYYEVLKKGVGAEAKVGDIVKVSVDGSSISEEFKIGTLSKRPGWLETLEYITVGLKAGEKRRVTLYNGNLEYEVLLNNSLKSSELELISINGKSERNLEPEDKVKMFEESPITVYHKKETLNTHKEIFTVKIGDTIDVGGSKLIISEVIKDDRCVIYADECSTSGVFELKALFSWVSTKNEKVFTPVTLTLGGSSFGNDKARLNFDEVKPFKEKGKVLSGDDYQFVFSVVYND